MTSHPDKRSELDEALEIAGRWKDEREAVFGPNKVLGILSRALLAAQPSARGTSVPNDATRYAWLEEHSFGPADWQSIVDLAIIGERALRSSHYSPHIYAAALPPAQSGKEAAQSHVEPHPYLQMAAGNHSIGVFKDGKLIAADEEVYAPPSSTGEQFTLGAYTLSPGRESGKVWIEHETGEGGDFKASKVEAVIAAFYKEHF